MLSQPTKDSDNIIIKKPSATTSLRGLGRGVGRITPRSAPRGCISRRQLDTTVWADTDGDTTTVELEIHILGFTGALNPAAGGNILL